MKVFSRTLIILAITAFIANSSQAGLMDESDCLRGPFLIGSDVSAYMSQLDSRIAACFNYSQSIETKNNNRLLDLISNLEIRISGLEREVDRLRSK